MRARSSFAVICIALILGATLTGCSKAASEDKPEPKVKPPAVSDAGVLRAGVDLSYPPFAGRDEDREAGIDVDVAAALAERLGLTLELVDVRPSEAATALATGEADIVLSVPLTADALGALSLAGTYVDDGAAYFTKIETTPSAQGANVDLQPELLQPAKIAVQTGSPSFWSLQEEYGEGAFQAYPTIRAAVEAAQADSATVVVGDALVLAYITRDFPQIVFAQQYGLATPLGVAVGPDNITLGDAVRSALDALAADGVLDAIRSKWVGELPKLATTAEELRGESASGSAEPSTADTP